MLPDKIPRVIRVYEPFLSFQGNGFYNSVDNTKFYIIVLGVRSNIRHPVELKTGRTIGLTNQGVLNHYNMEQQIIDGNLVSTKFKDFVYNRNNGETVSVVAESQKEAHEVIMAALNDKSEVITFFKERPVVIVKKVSIDDLERSYNQEKYSKHRKHILAMHLYAGDCYISCDDEGNPIVDKKGKIISTIYAGEKLVEMQNGDYKIEII